MRRLGLTGGIGSGKTRVADTLARWGAGVVDADQVAHDLTGPGGGAMAALVSAFGPDCVDGRGALDRALMRQRAFADPAVRRQLEAILHPMIRAEIERRLACLDAPYALVVVPLLIESGDWINRVDAVVVVDCEPETQIARVMARNGLTREQVQAILAAQASREQRLAAASVVINNGAAMDQDGLERQLRPLHEAWQQDRAVPLQSDERRGAMWMQPGPLQTGQGKGSA